MYYAVFKKFLFEIICKCTLTQKLHEVMISYALCISKKFWSPFFGPLWCISRS